MVTLGIISHYKKMSTTFLTLGEETQCKLVFKYSGLNHAIACAKDMETMYKVDAIIAISATIDYIKPHVYVPVIPIYMTHLNIIEALYRAKYYGKKIVFVNMEHVIKKYNYDFIHEIMNYDIENYTFETIDQSNALIEKAIREKKDVLVTPVEYIVSKANKRGLTAIVVELQKFDLLEAIERAKHVVEIREQEIEKMKWLHTIIHNLSEGLLIFDHKGVISTMNQAAEKIIHIDSKELIGKPIETLKSKYTFFNKIDLLNEIEVLKINQTEMIIDKKEIIVGDSVIGKIIKITGLKNLQNLEIKTRQKINPQGFIAVSKFEDLISTSRLMEDVKDKGMKYARTDANILIFGESGSGKELLAQSIHNYSQCQGGPFVAVNCATFPEQLLESELFGYTEGAFTGAKKGGKMGLLELAHEGTLFLDEIGEMPIQLQARLLRVLQDKVVRRIGGEKNIPVKVRIISATNKNLYSSVRERAFREDLFYRINVLNINLPPLRNRKEDIEVIALDYVNRIAHKQQRLFKLDKKFIVHLQSYHWPGNVRELNNFIERLLILSDGNEVKDETFMELFAELQHGSQFLESEEPTVDNPYEENLESIRVPLGDLETMEMYIIEALFQKYNKDKKEIAQLLNLSPTTLWRRFKAIEQKNA
jgi:transcriptional regulator with PAS, ATPase and Fis domain